MTTEIDWSDEETWESIADMPLDPKQISELVAVCDRRPDLWKRYALALLEEQVLRHELRTWSHQHVTHGEATTKDRSSVSAPTPLPSPTHQVNGSQASRTQASGGILSAQFWNSLALAATVLIAFGIGWQASQRFGVGSNPFVDGASFQDRVASNNNPFNASTAGLNTHSNSVGHALNDAPGQTMLAGTPRSPIMDAAAIDQVNAETLTKALQVDWKDDTEAEYLHLKRLGYDVESHEGLMPIWLHDGSSAVIPYQQIKVRPKARAY